MQACDTLSNDFNLNVAISRSIHQPENRKRSKRASMSHAVCQRTSPSEPGRLCRRASLDINAHVTCLEVYSQAKISRRASINAPGKVYRRASLNTPGKCSTSRRYSCSMGTEQSSNSESIDHNQTYVRKKLIPAKYDCTDCEMMEKKCVKLKFEKAKLFAKVDCLIFKKKQKDLKIKQAKERIEEQRLARTNLINSMTKSSLCNEKAEEELSSMKYEYEKDLEAHKKEKLEHNIMKTKYNHTESLANELRQKDDESEQRIAKIKLESITMKSDITAMLYEKNELESKNLQLREKLELMISDIHELCRIGEINRFDPIVVASVKDGCNVEIEIPKKQSKFSLNNGFIRTLRSKKRDDKPVCYFSKAG